MIIFGINNLTKNKTLQAKHNNGLSIKILNYQCYNKNNRHTFNRQILILFNKNNKTLYNKKEIIFRFDFNKI